MKKPAYFNARMLTGFFCAVIVLLSWASLSVQLDRDRERVLQDAFMQADNMTRAFEEHSLRTVENVRQVLVSLKEIYEKRGGGAVRSFEEAANASVARYAIESREAQSALFNLLSIADENGDLVLSSQVPFNRVNIVYRPFFLAHRAGETGFLVGTPILGTATGKWYIPMSLALKNADGSFGGVVLASVNPFYFSDFYSRVQLGNQGFVLLISASGEILAGVIEGREVPFGTSVSASRLFSAMSGSEEGALKGIGLADGVPRLLSYRAVSRYPLFVAVGLAEDIVLRGYRQRRTSMIAGVIIFNLFVAGFFLAFRRVANRERRAEERFRETIINSMAILAEHRDKGTGAHIQRTKAYVKLLLERSGSDDLFPRKDLPLIWQSAALHDIGKVGVPDAILLKPGSLTREEFEIVMQHPLIGGEVLERTQELLGKDSFVVYAREITEFHHEKWDGSGYPRGLKGEEIPLLARIMAIADVYDAIVTRRPYKEPLEHGEAVAIIRAGAGVHFDPGLVEVFLSSEEEFDAIAKKIPDPDESVDEMQQ